MKSGGGLNEDNNKGNGRSTAEVEGVGLNNPSALGEGNNIKE